MSINASIRLLLTGFSLGLLLYFVFIGGAIVACDRAGDMVVNPIDPLRVACADYSGKVFETIDNVSVDFDSIELTELPLYGSR